MVPRAAESKVPYLRIPIYCSKYWERNANLVLLISNLKTQPGIWSRTLCIDQGFNQGSMIPYVEKALSNKYAVMIANPYINTYKLTDGSFCKIPGSETPEDHLRYIYETFIQYSACSNLFIVVYGYSGIVLQEVLTGREIPCLKAIAFLESYHKLPNNESGINNFYNSILIETII